MIGVVLFIHFFLEATGSNAQKKSCQCRDISSYQNKPAVTYCQRPMDNIPCLVHAFLRAAPVLWPPRAGVWDPGVFFQLD